MKHSHIYSDHNPSHVPKTALVGLSWRRHKNHRIWLCLLKWVAINAMQIANKNVLVTVMLCILINRHWWYSLCTQPFQCARPQRLREENLLVPKEPESTREMGQWRMKWCGRLRGRERGRSLGAGRPLKPEPRLEAEKLELCAPCLCISIGGYPLSPWSCRWWILTPLASRLGNPGSKRGIAGFQHKGPSTSSMLHSPFLLARPCGRKMPAPQHVDVRCLGQGSLSGISLCNLK